MGHVPADEREATHLDASRKAALRFFIFFRTGKGYITKIRGEMLEESDLCGKPVFCAVFFPVVGPDGAGPWRCC